MVIVEDQQVADLIKGKIAAYIDKSARTPDGLYHVSDLLNPRYAYFKQKFGHAITETEMGFFVSGIAFHEFLQKILGKEMSEVQLRLENIVGTADQAGVFFSEIKTSRKWTIPEGADPIYVEQFEKYLAMAGRSFGHIIVIYFTANRSWDGKKPSTLEIKSWKVTMSEQDRVRAKNVLIERRDGLKLVQDGVNSYESLPLCWAFKCGKEYKGEVQNLCPFYYSCRPEGRYPLAVLIKNSKKPDTYRDRVRLSQKLTAELSLDQ